MLKAKLQFTSMCFYIISCSRLKEERISKYIVQKRWGVCREDNLFIVNSLVGYENETDQHRLTGQKHRNLMSVLCDMGAFTRKLRPKEMVKPDLSIFILYLMKVESHGTPWQDKGYELKVLKGSKWWGTNNKGHSLRFLWASLCLHLWRQDAAFLIVERGHLSHEGLVTCFRGECGGQRVLSAPSVSRTCFRAGDLWQLSSLGRLCF